MLLSQKTISPAKAQRRKESRFRNAAALVSLTNHGDSPQSSIEDEKTQHAAHELFAYLLFTPALLHRLANAQAGRAELIGEVRDQTGASVSAIITATEVATDQTLTRTTDDGAYLLTSLKPGIYTVTVAANGFKRSIHENIRLATGERIRLDVVLEPRTVSELVTVTQDASLLRTESGSLGQVINNRKIVDIPLNGRNFLSLITLSATSKHHLV